MVSGGWTPLMAMMKIAASFPHGMDALVCPYTILPVPFGPVTLSTPSSALEQISLLTYFNSLWVGLPNVRLSPLQSVLNVTARLIARLFRTFHISAFMFDHFYWLPFIARLQLKVLTLIYRSYISQALKYLRDLIRLPSSAISLRPLYVYVTCTISVPRAKNSMAKTRAFPIIGPVLWNQLPPVTCSFLLTGEQPSRHFPFVI